MASISNQGAASQVAFGQYGSAFADTAVNEIRPPAGLVVVAISFLADSSLSSLVAEEEGKVFNSAHGANRDGQFTRQVNQSTATTNKIIFDDTNEASGVKIGDEVFDNDGDSHGVVTALDPDGDNANEIQVSVSTAVTNDRLMSFVRPQRDGGEGMGGQKIDTSQVFPKGMTIYGRWTEVSLQADDSDGGIICYFGP